MRIEGLIEVIIRAFFERHGPFHRFTDLSEQDDRDPVALPAQAAQHFAAVHAGHEHIHHDQIRAVLCDILESLLAIAGDDHLKARPLEEGRQVGSNGGFIIDEKDFWIG